MSLKERLEKLGKFFTKDGAVDYEQISIHLEIPKELSLIHKEQYELDVEYKEKLEKIADKRVIIQKKCKHPITKNYYGYETNYTNCEICGKEM